MLEATGLWTLTHPLELACTIWTFKRDLTSETGVEHEEIVGAIHSHLSPFIPLHTYISWDKNSQKQSSVASKFRLNNWAKQSVHERLTAPTF